MTIFETLAEPNRRRILDELRHGERAVGDLVEILDISQPTVSQHLKALRSAGLVTTRADANRRIYRLDPAPLVELDAWLAPFREIWADRLDALERHLDATYPPDTPSGDDR